jgi:hypothetical protein
MGDSMKLGGGGRFKKFTGKLESEGYSAKSADAIAASAGRKKYGGKKFAALGQKKSSFYGGK